MRLTRDAVTLGTRVTLTGLVLGAMTLAPSGVQAQTPAPAGANATVEIKEVKGGSKPATPAAAPKEAMGAKKAVTERDPFVKQVEGGVDITKTKGGAAAETQKVVANNPKPAGKKDAKGAEPPKEPEKEVPPPEVKVQGILLSAHGSRAILSSPNQTYIVHAGDKLGDYKVDSIEDRTVVFRFKDKTFKLKLSEEFAGVGKSSGGKKK